MSQWLFEGLACAGLPVICIETRHVKAFLSSRTRPIALTRAASRR